jgi:hypothetical protein
MPDLKYLYRVLYILFNCFFKQIVDISFNKDYYQESNILIIACSRVATVAEWLDGSVEGQSSPAVVLIHFSDVTLLFEQWIIFKNLQFIRLFLNIWTLTFYCFRLNNVFYLFLRLSCLEPLLGYFDLMENTLQL